jgi:glycosyltransferase involved in cell wall biosynthesis
MTDHRPDSTHISVVIPARNAGRTIGAQLTAMSSQDYAGPIEVIVVDDGSSDDTRVIVKMQGLSEVRLVEATGARGPGAARNRGAEAARGDVLAFCDADDIVSPSWLSALARALDTADLVLGRLDYTMLNPDPLLARAGGGREWTPQPHRGFLLSGASANMAIRRLVFEELGGFDAAFTFAAAEDVDLCWRAHLRGFRVQVAHDALVHYRLRESARGAARQHFRYAAEDPRLFRRYRTKGMRRESMRKVGRDLAWLAKHAPGALVSEPRRAEWLRGAAVRLGRLTGSVRERVFYP